MNIEALTVRTYLEKETSLGYRRRASAGELKKQYEQIRRTYEGSAGNCDPNPDPNVTITLTPYV